MSSYIQSPEHFNTIEHKLHLMSMSSDSLHLYVVRKCVPMWYDKHNQLAEIIEKEISDLINTIRELQVLCVSLQYKHHYEGKLDQEISEQMELISQKTEAKSIDKISLYKLLCSTSYQIEIEHLKELRGLTEAEQNAMFFLEEFLSILAHNIIMSMPEYEQAEWGV